MADGVILLVDAFEGPMPQTRFVLQKAIELNLKPIVVINKVDKPNCNPIETQEKVFDLMFNLGATEEQLDFPTVYGSSKQGWMGEDWQKPTEDVSYLLDQIIEHIPAYKTTEGTTQLMISSLDFSSYVGRIAVGRLHRGTLIAGQDVTLAKANGEMLRSKIKELYVFEGLAKEKIKSEVQAGEICAILGLENFDIGDTVCDVENPEPLKPIKVDDPTMSMLFTINNSPFYGKDGKFVTSRHLRERLYAELEKYLCELCKVGLSKRLNGNVPKEYQDRLFYELKVINEMGFPNYFLVVYDFIRFAKKNGILVGPGRGSAAGSLVAYSLGITDIDPIKSFLTSQLPEILYIISSFTFGAYQMYMIEKKIMFVTLIVIPISLVASIIYFRYAKHT